MRMSREQVYCGSTYVVPLCCDPLAFVDHIKVSADRRADGPKIELCEALDTPYCVHVEWIVRCHFGPVLGPGLVSTLDVTL